MKGNYPRSLSYFFRLLANLEEHLCTVVSCYEQCTVHAQKIYLPMHFLNQDYETLHMTLSSIMQRKVITLVISARCPKMSSLLVADFV